MWRYICGPESSWVELKNSLVGPEIFSIDSEGYKSQKERFVTGFQGSSALDLFIRSCSIPLLFLFSGIIRSRVRTFGRKAEALLEFTALWIPLLLSFTVLSSAALTIDAFLLSFIIYQIYTNSAQRRNAGFKDLVEQLNSRSQRNWLTVFRTCVMLSTVISIFAVDFIVFPRNFAKTETFGISLMDLGVGFFILSNGISASVKRPHISNQISLWKILRSVSPLLVLGGSRFFMVKASNYQEHASEYGTHWNFFMTLAVVASASTFIHSKFPKFPYLLCGISIAAVYETLLTFTRLDDWILNAPRIGFISANKEGISSCMGYMSLYLTSFAIGKSLFKKRNAVQWISLLKKVTAVTVLMWTTWIIILDQNNGLSLLSPPSRRMANLGYTSVVTLLGLSHIIIILWGSLLLPVSQQHPGPISQAINSNQLVFFLISNLLTGAINLSIQTIYRSCSSSMNILTLYLSVLALVAYVGLAFKLKLKFW